MDRIAATLSLAALLLPLPALADGQLDPTFGTAGIARPDSSLGQDIPLALDVRPWDGHLVVTGYNLLVGFVGVRTELDADGQAPAYASYPSTDALRDTVWDDVVGERIGGWKGADNVLSGEVVCGPELTYGPVAGFTAPRIAASGAAPTNGMVAVGPYFAFGSAGDWKVCRTGFLPDCSWLLDPAFHFPDGCLQFGFDLGAGGLDVPNALAVAELGPGEKVLLAGTARTGALGPADSSFAIARLTDQGALDPSFGTGGRLAFSIDADATGRDEALAMELRPDGWIALAGFSGATDNTTWGVAALVPPGGTPGGVRNQSYRLGGHPTRFDDLALVGDRLYVAGRIHDGVESDVVVARLRRDLSLDSGFGTGGWVRIDASGVHQDDRAVALVLQDGRPVVAGEVATGGYAAFAVLRLTGSLLFADGFEGGGSQLWSSVTP